MAQAQLPIDDADAKAEAAARASYRGHVRPNPRILEGLIPVAAYIIVNSLYTTQAAIAVSFAASVVVFVRNRGNGVIRVLSAIGFLAVAVSAVLGLISGSGKIYVAQNLVTDFLFAAIFAASVVIGRPLIGAIVREFVPALKPVMAIDHPLFARLTLLSAAINAVEGVARVFMLRELTDNQYIIISRVVFIPLSVAFYYLCYQLVQREAIRIWPADLPPPNRDGTPGS